MIKKIVRGIIFGTYLICWVFRVIEYLIIRTDQVILGELFLHGLVGVLVVAACLLLIQSDWSEIGFFNKRVVQNIVFGIALEFISFGIAWVIGFTLAEQYSYEFEVAYFVTSQTVENNIGIQMGPMFLVLYILGNAINVFMEEGLFRGLYVKLFEQKYSFLTSALISSGLFGFWHTAAPLRSFLDGKISVSSLIASSLIQIVLTGIFGLQLCLLVKITGSLWASMAVHFVNNFIVNTLNIVIISGTDATQSLQNTIAHTLSFFIVLTIFIIQKSYQKKTFRK